MISQLTVAWLRQRPGASLVIVIGMACVAGVLVTMLSVDVGVMRAFRAAGDPGRAIVFGSQAVNEYAVDLDRSAVETISSAPGIAAGKDGRPIADAEILINAPPADGFAQGSLAIRGIGPQGLALRPDLAIIAGRMFESGRQELIVGAGAVRVFHFKVGDTVLMPNGEWPIVGEFSGGGLLSGQLMADANTLMSATRKAAFGTVVLKLESAASFAALEQWLTHHPALAVTVERQSDYYERQGAQITFYTTMALLVGGIMSVGALFAATHILYSAVSARTRAIATLRAIGYEPLPLATSVLFEALLLSLVGALTGCLVAWCLFDGHQSVFFSCVFNWSISPGLIALGVSWVLLVAVLGAILPATRAARLSVVEALRAL
jgi:putative ABC transport system permease protein